MADTNTPSLAEVVIILANTLTTRKTVDIYRQMATLRQLLSSLDADDERGEHHEECSAYFPSLISCLIKMISSSELNACKRNGEILQSMAIRREWIGCVLILLALNSSDFNDASRKEGRQFSSAGINNSDISVDSIVQQCSDVCFGRKTGSSIPSLRSAALDLMIDLFSDVRNSIITPSKNVIDMRAKLCESWSTVPFDIIQLIYKNWFRISPTNASMRASSILLSNSILKGCIVRQRNNLQGKDNGNTFHGDLLSEKNVSLLVKLVKRAAEDKSPEVRYEVAHLTSSLGCASIVSIKSNKSKSKSDPQFNLYHIDELLHFSLQNVDDKSTGVASIWAEAASICLSTAISYGVKHVQSDSNSYDLDGDNITEENSSNISSSSVKQVQTEIMSKFKAFSDAKKELKINSCLSLNSSLKYLCELFIKTGGEAVSNGCGGTYSEGGRNSRAGLTLVIINLLRRHVLPVSFQKDPTAPTSVKKVLSLVLSMVGPVFERQLALTEVYVSGSFEAPNATNENSQSLHNVNKSSSNDATMARYCVNQVLRRGLGAILSEPNQQTLLMELADYCYKNNEREQNALNPHQLQCALIEISHLVTALADASAGVFDVLFPTLKSCLSHSDYGVRWEASTAVASISYTIANEKCMNFIQDFMDGVRSSHETISELAQSRMFNKRTSSPVPNSSKKRSLSPTPPGKFVSFQYSLHGHALALSMILHESYSKQFLVSDDKLFDLVGIAEILILCQFDEQITMINPGAACTQVRAGYSILSAALASGPNIEQHIERITKCWARTTKCVVEGSKHFNVAHDIICLEALLSCLVSFLRFRASFLLTIPGLLSRVTLCLETLLSLVVPQGRLGAEPGNVAAENRLDTVKAAIFEAFAWLPPGCYPVASESLYQWALDHILDCTEKEIESSLLSDFISNEDDVLGLSSICKATTVEQIGNWCELSEAFTFLSCSPCDHREREGIMHSPIWRSSEAQQSSSGDLIYGSSILGNRHSFQKNVDPPTPLHNVGIGASWKEPPIPVANSKVRLIDSAIHIFAIIFGLLDGRKQEQGMLSLMELMPSSLTESGGGKFNVGNALMTETEKKLKTKEDMILSQNLVTVLLASIRSFPQHEAGTATDKGPPWMKHASSMLFMMLSSPYTSVQRGSAECLAALALSTRGIGGGTHWLQQEVVDNLEEFVKGNNPNGKPRKGSSRTLTRSKAAALFALACFQRQSFRFSKSSRELEQSISKQSEADFLICSPLSKKIRSCLLSNIAEFEVGQDYMESAVYVLHSLQILVSNSAVDKVKAYGGVSKLRDERISILMKAMNLTELLFVKMWIERGESEKCPNIIALNAAFFRMFMSLLLEFDVFPKADPSAVEKICKMAGSLFFHMDHPSTLVEYQAFVEVLISSHSASQSILEDFVRQSVSMTYNGLLSHNLQEIASGRDYRLFFVLSFDIFVDKNCPFIQSQTGNDLYVRLLSQLEQLGQRNFPHSMYYRSVSCGRYHELDKLNTDRRYLSTYEALDKFLEKHYNLSGLDEAKEKIALYRALITGSVDHDTVANGEEGIFGSDISYYSSFFFSPRWQVKAYAVKCAHIVCSTISDDDIDEIILESAVSIACSATTATSNNEELLSCQLEGIKMLSTVLLRFASYAYSEVTLASHFSSQIAAAIRHSISASKKNQALFNFGCKSLRHFSIGITDVGMLRRLVRPLLRSAADLNMNNLSVDSISCICTLVDLRYKAESKILHDNVGEVFISEYANVSDNIALVSSFMLEQLNAHQDTNIVKTARGDVIELLPIFSFSVMLSSNETIIKKVAPLLFFSVRNFLEESVIKQVLEKKAIVLSFTAWVYGLRQLVKSKLSSSEPEILVEMAHLCKLLSFAMLKFGKENEGVSFEIIELSTVILKLIEDICMLRQCGQNQDLFCSVILPLHSLPQFKIDALSQREMIVSLMHSSQIILDCHQMQQNDKSLTVCRSFTTSAINIIESLDDSFILEEATKLLKLCFSSKFMDSTDIRILAYKAAKKNEWKTWGIISSCLNDDSGIICCVNELQNALSSESNAQVGPIVLEEICRLVKSKSPNSSTIQSVMHSLGEIIFSMFYNYGTNGLHSKELSLAVCKDSITILSLAFQNIIQHEQHLSQFVTLCVKHFAAVIQVNGLPNQPKGGNENLGRLCSAVCVHWARASSNSFKICLSQLSESERSIIEHAVRSEMSGHRMLAKPKLLARV